MEHAMATKVSVAARKGRATGSATSQQMETSSAAKSWTDEPGENMTAVKPANGKVAVWVHATRLLNASPREALRSLSAARADYDKTAKQ